MTKAFQPFDKMDPAVDFHEHLAETWDAKYSRRSFRARIDTIHRLLAERSVAGQRWLDAGCGTGTLSRELAGSGCIVSGVDASPAMIRHAIDLSGRLADRLTFETVDSIESLPLADQSFDGVLCSSVIEYVEDPTRCLREIGRVLRPGGLLIVSVPNARSLLRTMHKLCFRMTGLVSTSPVPRYLGLSRHEYSAAGFCAVLERTGFRLLRRGYCGWPFGGRLGQLGVFGSLLFVLAEKRPADEGRQP